MNRTAFSIAATATVALTLLLAACGSTKSDQTDGDKPAADKLPIKTQEVRYSVGETTLKGFIAWDPNIKGERPGIVVVHEWWGHTEYVRKRAVMLAELGYTALAVDMYGDGKTADHPDEAKKFMMETMAKAETSKERFEAGLTYLKNHDTVKSDKVAAIGYCFGGGIVLGMARAGMDLAGVVSFHGSLGTQNPAQSGAVKAKVLVLNGAADPMVSKDMVAKFEEEMKAAGVDYRVVNYEGAKHAFTNPAATEKAAKLNFPAIGYNEAADKASWSEMKAFFSKLFGG